MKHAPAPWYWTKKYPTIDGRETWTLVSDAPGKHGILSCDGEHNSPETADRNLIEAAPELLDACRTALYWATSNDTTSDTRQRGLENVRAIIRKAEGGGK